MDGNVAGRTGATGGYPQRRGEKVLGDGGSRGAKTPGAEGGGGEVEEKSRLNWRPFSVVRKTKITHPLSCQIFLA